MALKQNISNSNYPSVVRATLGITEDVNELYIKITSLHQQEQSCQVRADFFHRVLQEKVNEEDEDLYELIPLKIPSVYQTFIVDESEQSTNTRKQGYEYLKTLPEFEYCEDC